MNQSAQVTTGPIRIINRWSLVCVILGVAAIALAQQKAKPYLRITSPPNGNVVRPGQRLVVTVVGAGEYPGVVILGEGLQKPGAIVAPMGNPPWHIPVEIPLNTDLGKTAITATGTTLAGEEVDSDSVQIDIEPVEIPPVKFTESSLFIPLDGCIGVNSHAPICGQTLLIFGAYPDGTEVSMNQSTRLTFVSKDPSIAYVNAGRDAIVGRSPGTTSIVFFGKYAISATVR